MMNTLEEMIAGLLADISGESLRGTVRAIVLQSRFYAINNSQCAFLEWELQAIVDAVTSYILGDMTGGYIALSHDRSIGSETDPESLAESESLEWLLEQMPAEKSTPEGIGRFFVCLCFRYRHCTVSLAPISLSYVVVLLRHCNRLRLTHSEAEGAIVAADKFLSRLNQVFLGIERQFM